MSEKTTYKMGWLRDWPDARDYTPSTDSIAVKLRDLGEKDSVNAMLQKVGVLKAPRAVPSSVDLRRWCSPIEDQEDLGSCTANAGVGLVEYFERRAYGKHIDASRLFLYKTTRNMLHLTGDTGAFLRSTIGAMAIFGVPPEVYWPYKPFDAIPGPMFDTEPPAFCYSFAQNFKALTYYRLDPSGTPKPDLLNRIKTYIAAGLPQMFGFTVFSSYVQAKSNGMIPYPARGEEIAGGHAVDAVGYDDSIKIVNTNSGGPTTVGALLIRNSWGTGWGNKGYGWLPYDYVLNGMAVDWWSLLKNGWIDTGEFKI
ncbi:MAG TPA: C1 family peptidase [Methanothrix soehngenii]|nr:C1 family peptidase [Methanothrix soehngenii]HPT19349.1 C1 family peptidase [Methanothrix sp.]